MMGTTHSVTGIALWAGAGPLVTSDVETLVAGLVLGAVLPYGADLDHGQSTASRALWGPFHRYAGGAVARVLGGHRAGAHSLWACLTFAALGAALGAWWNGEVVALAVAGLLGWFGGILGDLLTKQGVRFLWPASSRRFRLARLTTGGVGEQLFNIAQGLLAMWFVYLHVG